MANDTMPAAHYETRRQSRRAGVEATRGSWKRKAVGWTAVTLTATVLGTGVWIYWHLTHVWTVRASVCGALVHMIPSPGGVVVAAGVSALPV